MSDIVSKCLSCSNFSGKPEYVAKRNNGLKTVNSREYNWCLKHDYDLPIIDREGEIVPDISECSSFNKK